MLNYILLREIDDSASLTSHPTAVPGAQFKKLSCWRRDCQVKGYHPVLGGRCK